MHFSKKAKIYSILFKKFWAFLTTFPAFLFLLKVILMLGCKNILRHSSIFFFNFQNFQVFPWWTPWNGYHFQPKWPLEIGKGSRGRRALNFFSFWWVCAARVSKSRVLVRVFLEKWGVLGAKKLLLRAENLAKNKAENANFLKFENGEHMSGTWWKIGRIGSADWSEKRGSWPRHIPVPPSNGSAPPSKGFEAWAAYPHPN